MTAAALGAAGCSDPPPPPAPLRVSMDLWAGYFPALLAEARGDFRAAGLDVRVDLPGNTARMMAELAARRVDLVCVALADLLSLARGSPVQVVMLTDESAGGDEVLLRPGGSLAAPRLTLGTSLGGFGELLLNEFVQRRGLDGRRLAWVHVDAADVPAALVRGAIDVGHTWAPYSGEARAAGAQTVFSSADTPGLIPDVMAGLKPTLDARADEVRRLVGAWFRAQAWWLEHRAEGDALLARRLDRTPAWVAEQLRGVALRTLAHNRDLLGRAADGPLAATLQRYGDFFVRHGTLTRPPEPAGLLRADLLP